MSGSQDDTAVGGMSDALFRGYLCVLDRLVGVLAAAGGTAAVEVLLDVVPAESAYLIPVKATYRYN